MKKDIKIYIGTLYVGENEFDESRQSILSQTFKNITHEVFSYLPNKEAHDRLYSQFMNLQNEYDYFIKLDADMVFIDNNLIDKIIDLFQENLNLDHAIFSVWDWYSKSNILGMHVYSKRVKWTISNEALFVDQDPSIKGVKKIFWDIPSPVAYHSHNPSIEEAFLFGLHRGLKVIQRGRLKKEIENSEFQFDLLFKTWNALIEEKTIGRAAAIYGAEEAFKGNQEIIEAKHEVMKYKKKIEEIELLGVEEIIKRYKKNWDQRENGFKKRKFMYITLHKILQYIPRKIYRLIIKKTDG